MSGLILLALAAASANVRNDFSREWQSCLVETSKLWATKPGAPDVIVDAATIYCRDKLELFMIAQTDRDKEIGLNEAQAAEHASFLAGSLLRINRGFAIDAVEKARGK